MKSAWRIAIGLCVAGIGAAAVVYATSSAEIDDVKLVSIAAARLGDIPNLELEYEMPPQTLVFRVRFSTATDLAGLANGIDAYTVRNQLLVGNDACTPEPKELSFSRVADMLVDAPQVHDELGDVENGASRPARSNAYFFYFGVMPTGISEFLSAGLREEPMCFTLRGTAAYTRRTLSSNIVLLPADALAAAATRLEAP